MGQFVGLTKAATPYAPGVNDLARLFRRAVRLFAGHIDAGGSPVDPFPGLVDILSQAFTPIHDAIVLGGQRQAPVVARRLGVDYAFNAIDPRAVAYAEQFSGNMVVEVTARTRDGIRQNIVDSFNMGNTVDQTAMAIRRSIGLHERWATASNRYYDRMIREHGIARGTVLGDRYYNRLLRARSRTIARTEIMKASNTGRALSWMQAADAGWIDPATTGKRWMATRPCAECASLNGKTVLMLAEFDGGYFTPPAHPNCKCVSVLVPNWKPRVDGPPSSMLGLRKYAPGQARDYRGRFASGLGTAVAGLDHTAAVDRLLAGERVEVPGQALGDVMVALIDREPAVDLSNVHVTDRALFDGMNLNIARDDMPQVPAAHKSQFLAGLAKEGVAVTHEQVDPRTLHPTQHEIQAGRAGKLVQKIRDGEYRTGPAEDIIVAKDGFILDGHHRWAAVAAESFVDPNLTMGVHRVDMGIRDLLSHAEDYNVAHGVSRRTFKQLVQKYAPGQPRDDHGRFASTGSGSGTYRRYGNTPVEASEADLRLAAEYHDDLFDLVAAGSRTFSGEVDTTGSEGKADLMEAQRSASETAAAARRNYEDALIAVARAANSAEITDVTELADHINRTLGAGLVKEGVLLRTGESSKFPYTRVDDLPTARAQFAEEFATRLIHGDPIETAAWVNYRLDFTDHPYADGVGRTAKMVAAIPLMRAGLPLPRVVPRSEWYGNAPTQRVTDVTRGEAYTGTGEFAQWESFYRDLIPVEKYAPGQARDQLGQFASGYTQGVTVGSAGPVEVSNEDGATTLQWVEAAGRFVTTTETSPDAALQDVEPFDRDAFKAAVAAGEPVTLVGIHATGDADLAEFSDEVYGDGYLGAGTYASVTDRAGIDTQLGEGRGLYDRAKRTVIQATLERPLVVEHKRGDISTEDMKRAVADAMGQDDLPGLGQMREYVESGGYDSIVYLSGGRYYGREHGSQIVLFRPAEQGRIVDPYLSEDEADLIFGKAAGPRRFDGSEFTLVTFDDLLSPLTKYAPGQPRDRLGQFASTNGISSSTTSIVRSLTGGDQLVRLVAQADIDGSPETIGQYHADTDAILLAHDDAGVPRLPEDIEHTLVHEATHVWQAKNMVDLPSAREDLIAAIESGKLRDGRGRPIDTALNTDTMREAVTGALISSAPPLQRQAHGLQQRMLDEMGVESGIGTSPSKDRWAYGASRLSEFVPELVANATLRPERMVEAVARFGWDPAGVDSLVGGILGDPGFSAVSEAWGTDLTKYAPGQPRDAHGRFASTGGSGGLPPEPGTAPIPDGALRLYHFTRPQNMDSILTDGLLQSKAIGDTYGEPNMVWASAQQPNPEVNYVEFYAYSSDLDIGSGFRSGDHTFTPDEIEHREQLGANVTVRGDVPPDRIVSHNRSWYDTARELLDSPEQIQRLTDGEFDFLADMPEYAPALDYAKAQVTNP